MAPVFADRRGDTVVGLTRHGNGAFVLVSSGWLFSNEGLDEGGNLPFVMNLVTSLGRQSVLFDEYHHGYGARETLWSVAPNPVRFGLMQCAVALFLAVFSLSRRLKAPVPLPGEERSRAEYLTSMATLLQRARATGVALAQARREFASQVSRRFGLPGDASTQTLAAVLRERNPLVATRVEATLKRADSLIAQGRPPVEQALSAVQALFELRKETERIL